MGSTTTLSSFSAQTTAEPTLQVARILGYACTPGKDNIWASTTAVVGVSVLDKRTMVEPLL